MGEAPILAPRRREVVDVEHVLPEVGPASAAHDTIRRILHGGHQVEQYALLTSF